MFTKKVFLPLIFPFLISYATQPSVIKADDLMKRIANGNDTTYVINFWATWCGPCVQELPDFEKLNENYKNKKVKVILVSMDFLADYDSKLLPFLKKKNIKTEVMLLNETKADVFINKINPKWWGSIPATMIVNNAKKQNEFFEESLAYEFLDKKLKTLGN